ncbi:hypothetical protein [Pedobacter jeongneungensis]|nr:hypothetical protein [Pedobacter jeongneungensis]
MFVHTKNKVLKQVIAAVAMLNMYRSGYKTGDARLNSAQPFD